MARIFECELKCPSEYRDSVNETLKNVFYVDPHWKWENSKHILPLYYFTVFSFL